MRPGWRVDANRPTAHEAAEWAGVVAGSRRRGERRIEGAEARPASFSPAVTTMVTPTFQKGSEAGAPCPAARSQ